MGLMLSTVNGCFQRFLHEFFCLRGGDSAQRLLIRACRRNLIAPFCNPEQFSSCLTALVFRYVKWDHNPDLFKLLRRLKETLCVRCQPAGATAQGPVPSRAPQKSQAVRRLMTLLIWSFPPTKGSILQEQRRHSRVWELPVMTLSDATSNTYCHKGSYSNTIN